ncbi:hypothetical protein GJ744_001065 [Endocarpon pusillum]|uniref:Berberine/berberine-like domain-containing protein n=1 Tax=Endocarpon pusillum TaxID=364733 RepID=A0A8H7AA16_9EURO|nr:hypothetical protein GJ744_001065 [Endocarpon pusillum]
MVPSLPFRCLRTLGLACRTRQRRGLRRNRRLWNAGQPHRQPRTYVNYAQDKDYETLQSTYGYEPWRLDKQRSLKAKYDPQNRFRYFVPIVSASA